MIDLKSWPDWWRYVDSVIERHIGDDSGVDSQYQFIWSTCLPYKLTFDLRTRKIIPYQLITFDAKGDLNGKGSCKLIEKDNCTLIQFQWDVDTHKPWMSIASILFKPVFVWNHSRVMKSGEQSFIERLNVK